MEPNLGAVHRSAVPRGWIRVGGVLAALFGSYYWGAAAGDLTSSGTRAFYVSTVIGRLLLVATFAGIVAAGEVGPALLLPAVRARWLGRDVVEGVAPW